mmetsp:Transcript_38549/g.28415  ORF Transcript_38549/g.28415 Transcript_38549/m.28415 type:complete len:155 (-) Transcript_38549:256-720(-)
MNLTKEFNNRESKVAEDYKHAIQKVFNPYVPKPVRIKYIHYDFKSRKKQEKQTFPQSLFDLVADALKQVKMFVCKRKQTSDLMCKIKIQRGVVRTNCIDSLDRTNMAQEWHGYFVLLKQLKSLGIINERAVDMSSELYRLIIQIYSKMGDTISL